MQRIGKTPEEYFRAWQVSSSLKPFGIGRRVALVNVDLQRRYTDTATFATAYDGDPQQLQKVNALARAVRALDMPVVWTYVAYRPDGKDCGRWGQRSSSPTAIHTVGHDSPHAELDARLDVDRELDLILHKRMASAFFETHLQSYLVFHGIDSVIVTGGATSGCVRATVVDAMSLGYRVTVPEDCVADREEEPHFANLYDIATKYADVRHASEVMGMVTALAGGKA